MSIHIDDNGRHYYERATYSLTALNVDADEVHEIMRELRQYVRLRWPHVEWHRGDSLGTE